MLDISTVGIVPMLPNVGLGKVYSPRAFRRHMSFGVGTLLMGVEPLSLEDGPIGMVW